MGEHVYKATVDLKGTLPLADILRKIYGNDETTKRATSLKHNKSMSKEDGG